MKHNLEILLGALAPVILQLVLASNSRIPLMNPGNETFTVWGWINYISYEASLFLTPIALFAYFAYIFTLTHKEPALTKRLVTFAIAEGVGYTVFYYLLFGGGIYSYYQGRNYIQDGTYFYHWWFTGPLALSPYLAFLLWFIWPVVATVAAGFALAKIR
jgi:hypothetical protein